MKRLVQVALDRPVLVTAAMLAVTLSLGLLAALPSLWPATFAGLHPLEVDTDPENMLPADEPVRVFHNRMKKEFSLHDLIVVGVVNETHPQGVMNVESLGRIYELTQFAKGLQVPVESEAGRQEGVVAVDLIAPSTVDSIEQAGLGAVSFDWLMPQPPTTEEQALAVREKAERIPMLEGTLLSTDGKVIALYLPLTSKDISHQVATLLREKIATFEGDEEFLIAGLPVAEDTFGVEMFGQMAISAPLAMLVIFLLMYFFFRKLSLVMAPMVVAMAAVTCTMGLLVATGNTLHIMSSMIPIFIMPIAVLDAVHILSEFYDRYQETRDRRRAMKSVIDSLFTPMLYTSLTTSAGFASLALTPIPPVQVFGLFVAFGVMTAWFWTITFIPAAVMFIRPQSLEGFGMTGGAAAGSPLARLLSWMGRVTYHRAPRVLALTVLLAVLATYGISQIRVNHNPVKWFEPSHPIRRASDVLNEHLGGTYMAFLTLGVGGARRSR